mgnify:CR=1 FL=1
MGDEDEIWPGNQYDHQNFLLAQAIHRAAVLSKSNAPSDRGVKRARFKVLRLARSPSVLVEGGFMSSPRERSRNEFHSWNQPFHFKVGRGPEFSTQNQFESHRCRDQL